MEFLGPTELSFESCFSSLNIEERKPQERVVILTDPIFKRHITGEDPTTGEDHGEAPARMDAIRVALKNAGLKTINNSLPVRKAKKWEIRLCHTREYFKELRAQIRNLKLEGDEICSPFLAKQCETENVEGNFVISSRSFEVALYAAGTPLAAIDHILDSTNGVKRAFCCVRPPGHHAHAPIGSGFCLFNNGAIAAKYAIKKGIKKVVIVDWDICHGDGTQTLTEADPNIFYFSTHRHTNDDFDPGSHWGHREQTGVGEGAGTVLNCPIDPSKGSPRKAVRKAFDVELRDAMQKFRPELVLISCGFDAHKDDSLYGSNVGFDLKDEDFAYLTSVCVDIANRYANGRIVSILEGGYDLDALASASKAHVEALAQGV